MKTKYKHIHFEDVSYLYHKRTTSTWYCLNGKNIQLGRIEWYSPWRQYCFTVYTGIVLNAGCLKDIADFIKQLMEERKKKVGKCYAKKEKR